MKRPLNARQLTLTTEQKWVVMELRAHASHRPQIIHEYLKTQYPWLRFHHAWETGGNSAIPGDTTLYHYIHLLVSNVDDRAVYEYNHWPYFRLTI